MRLRPLALLLLFVAAPALAEEADAGRPAASDLEKLLAQTDEIARVVSELRALPIKKPIPRGIMSRAEITKRLILRLDEDNSPGEILIEERALKRLGLLPVDMDYRQTMIDLYSEQIAGFYDPQAKELYIADWIEPETQKIVLAHEIDHALQDQSFDLVRFVKPIKDNSDEQIARQALVEGDGLALMIEYLFREQGMKMDPWGNDAVVNAIGAAAGLSGSKLLDAAPLVLRETLFFPYRDGLRFIGASRKTHPWNDVDSMYAKPPASTEQVMHPAKYRNNEKPVALKLAPLPSLKTWKKPYSNVLGELGFAIFLRQHGLEKPRADAAAAGWGGDRLMLFQPTEGATLDETVAMSFSAWDAEMDAIEAHEAVAQALLALTKAEKHSEKTKTYAAAADAAGNLSFVERRGKLLLLVIGAPQTLAPKLRAEAWAKWK